MTPPTLGCGVIEVSPEKGEPVALVSITVGREGAHADEATLVRGEDGCAAHVDGR